mgnify:CR=1 FL=1
MSQERVGGCRFNGAAITRSRKQALETQLGKVKRSFNGAAITRSRKQINIVE